MVNPDLVRILYGERVATPDVFWVDIVYVDVLNYDIRGTIYAEAASLDDAIAADTDYGLVAVDYEWVGTGRVVLDR